uniref:Uncharacterized protein n=1 Tax=Aplysina aerophoba bacterial symbiont clone AANRPS TaxID=1042317 RepID=F8S2Y9_9BACT|nr:hypothetical protein [Aplysina aerophoba bacterial symbiont clone AANRPS]
MHLQTRTQLLRSNLRIRRPGRPAVLQKRRHGTVRIQRIARTAATGPLRRPTSLPDTRGASAGSLEQPDLPQTLQGLDSPPHPFGHRQPHDLRTVRAVLGRGHVARLDGRWGKEHHDPLHLHPETSPTVNTSSANSAPSPENSRGPNRAKNRTEQGDQVCSRPHQRIQQPRSVGKRARRLHREERGPIAADDPVQNPPPSAASLGHQKPRIRLDRGRKALAAGYLQAESRPRSPTARQNARHLRVQHAQNARNVDTFTTERTLWNPQRRSEIRWVSDPGSGVAHPIFFPAGRLDPAEPVDVCTVSDLSAGSGLHRPKRAGAYRVYFSRSGNPVRR